VAGGIVTPISEWFVDQLRVLVFADRTSAGAAAGEAAASALKNAVRERGAARAIFAAAPSQEEVLAHLAQCDDIDWAEIAVFQMDEYIGLMRSAPESFACYLAQRLFDAAAPGHVNVMRGEEPAESECDRYGALLADGPIDLVCLGIGENGHLAFNDPGVSDFFDSRPVARVTLTRESREQQVHDGCYARLEDVPRDALTLTLPSLLRGRELHCVVPGPRKRAAVTRTLQGPVTTDCPASVLRIHPRATLYLDLESQPSSNA
jgi:glucosamine-6-phosphate deaminase